MKIRLNNSTDAKTVVSIANKFKEYYSKYENAYSLIDSAV